MVVVKMDKNLKQINAIERKNVSTQFQVDFHTSYDVLTHKKTCETLNDFTKIFKSVLSLFYTCVRVERCGDISMYFYKQVIEDMLKSYLNFPKYKFISVSYNPYYTKMIKDDPYKNCVTVSAPNDCVMYNQSKKCGVFIVNVLIDDVERYFSYVIDTNNKNFRIMEISKPQLDTLNEHINNLKDFKILNELQTVTFLSQND